MPLITWLQIVGDHSLPLTPRLYGPIGGLNMNGIQWVHDDTESEKNIHAYHKIFAVS